MKEWASKTSSQSEEILREVSASTKASKLISYGKENLPAGPEIYLSNEVYVVEGRADVNVLLRSGISNVIAIEGTKIPQSVIKLAKEKKIIAFLDGDRGGDLIQKELLQVLKPKKIYRAPTGKEVEDLTPVEVLGILKEKPEEKPTKVVSEPIPEPKPKIPQNLQTKIKDVYPKINGTLEAVILDAKMKKVLQVPVNHLFESLSSQKNAKTIVFDGIVTQRLVDVCASIGAATVIGHRAGNIVKKPTEIAILTFEQLGLD